MIAISGKKIYRLCFDEYQEYEEMENFFELFRKEMNAELVENLDGPYSRIWTILINGTKYKLVTDQDYGSYIMAEGIATIQALKEIAPLIEKFIY